MAIKTETLLEEPEGGLSDYEVAKLWGISRSAVWFIRQRAIKKLRKAIEKEAAAAGVAPRDWLCGEE